MNEEKTTPNRGSLNQNAAAARPPLTREQILQRLAEVAKQKRANRLAIQTAKKRDEVDDALAQRTVQVLRSWLEE